MNKAVKKFSLTAGFAVFVLLAALLSVINIINFAMASDDADLITHRIADGRGMFGRDRAGAPEDMQQFPQNDIFRSEWRDRGGFGNMGPDSPETDSSVRYFTYAFDKEGNPQQIVFKMSAFSQEEAQQWAKSLLGGTTGWTRLTYRYRVYDIDGMTYVTVIDQGRELLPSYRILFISIAGGIAMLLISVIFFLAIGKRIFKPLEEADRKQKNFISDVENQFKLPLTVINANTELIEKRDGPTENTNIINRQVRKMTTIVKDMANFSVFDEGKLSISRINISDILMRVLDSRTEQFRERNISLEMDIQPEILIEGDGGAFKKVFSELADNALRYAVGNASFSLSANGSRVLLTAKNCCELPAGQADQVFDRFTTLKNAEEKNTAGLGLSFVRQTVKAHNGRVSARVADGEFTVKISL